MAQPAEPSKDRPFVVFAAGPGVGRVVECWRRGLFRPALVDVTEPNMRAAMLAESALAELHAAGIPIFLRLAPGAGMPTRLELTSVFASHAAARYVVAGSAGFMLRMQQALRSLGVEAAALAVPMRQRAAA